MDNQRLILFIALASVLMLIWLKWEEENRPADMPSAVVEKPASTPAVPESSTANTAIASPGNDTHTGGKHVKVTTDLLEVTINTKGADIEEVKLLKHAVTAKQKDTPFVLMTANQNERYITQSGFVGRDHAYPTHHTVYSSKAQAYALQQGSNEVDVVFETRASDGVIYRKQYTFHRDSYLVDISYNVINRSGKSWKGHLYTQFRRKAPKQEGGMMALPTYMGGAIYTPEEQYEKIGFDDIEDSELKRTAKGGWVAMLQHYFVASWIPPEDSENVFFGKSVGQDEYIYGMTRKTVSEISSGAEGDVSTQIYIGTKENVRLEQLVDGMDLTVDFGWLTFISAPLFWLLLYIHDWVGNWGWAIIILTVIIKLAFFPLSAASYKSMARMRTVQPKIQSLKDRYGSDKERFNREMMNLYRTEKINPLGGCLPILIQIPVFIALYWVLLESVEMRHAPFALWLTDLSSPDPYFVLPLLMGISMFAQHHLNPAPTDPMQKRIMQFLPAVFTVFFLFFPAGLVLYWVVNNILSIAQQWQITRMIESGKE